GLNPALTISCQRPTSTAMAASGQANATAAWRSREGAGRLPGARWRASSPASTAARSVPGSLTAMPADLDAEQVGDLPGDRGDVGVLDAAGTVEVDLDDVAPPSRPAGHQHHAVTEADRLADVVGDEDHGDTGAGDD